MLRFPVHILSLILLLLSLHACRAFAAPPMQMELVTERGFMATDSQRWIQFLAKLELTSIRIRTAEIGDRESISNVGTVDRPLYKVVGVLTSNNRLLLPGGEFGLGDREGLSKWIKKVETDGETGPTQKTAAFGLVPEKLVEFHEKLAPPTACVTKGRRCGDVARDIVKQLALEYNVSEAARRAFAAEDTFGDDLRGVSCGTALAAVVRPLGLVIRPEKHMRGFRLGICEVREAEESWPIGWPSEELPKNIAPKLFESLNVEIKDVTLAKSIDAIQPRVNIPFLFDYNGMARQRIDVNTVKVKYPKGRAMYRKVLDTILYQAKLSNDLRVDEAGRPFLWIAPR